MSTTYLTPAVEAADQVFEAVVKAQDATIDAVSTFTAALPANATGSYAVGIEGYKNFTINPNTVNSAVVRDVGFNKVFYFPVGAAKVAPRRQVVSLDKCNACHTNLSLHGANRDRIDADDAIQIFLNPFNFVELHFDNHDKSDNGKPKNSKSSVDCVILNRFARENGNFFFCKSQKSEQEDC